MHDPASELRRIPLPRTPVTTYSGAPIFEKGVPTFEGGERSRRCPEGTVGGATLTRELNFLVPRTGDVLAPEAA
jgi:hypothetical protein